MTAQPTPLTHDDAVLDEIPSPAYVLEERLLRRNLKRLAHVREQAGIQIILALKGFAMWRAFPLVRQYLDGATASSLNEARLCYEEMGSKAHTYAPVYTAHEMEQIAALSSHITFNSLTELERHYPVIQRVAPEVSCGLRVNPEYSTVTTELYNPCATGSRLGVTADDLAGGLPKGVEGLHFHALCESSSVDLEQTLASFERLFGHLLPQLRWVNMGGGHLITGSDYDPEHLIQLLRDFKRRHGVEVILEPGSAVAWQTGFLKATVCDILTNKGVRTAMLDISFTAHLPDTLEMPYRPRIRGASEQPTEEYHAYRLGGLSCLAGDYLESYYFPEPLSVGDSLIFEDMIHYTMVKTTMFNGVAHPSIAILQESGELEVVRSFTYDDFKRRLS